MLYYEIDLFLSETKFTVMKNIKNLIIGAGPAGLAVAGRMRKQGLDFEVLESTNNIADRWHHHYDRLLLHTVKQLSHLPYLEFPEDYPIYVPRAKLVEYYENYTKHFEIKPRFNKTVASIKLEDEGWKVVTESGKVIIAENVIMATGINRIPHIPDFKNQENFQGEIIHSINYKNALPFENKKVIGPKKDVLEVLNAIKIYENLEEYNPSNERSFLKAHKSLMVGLIENAGKYRNQSVGIVKGSKIEHLAPPYENVPYLMKDLFKYLEKSNEIELIKK